MDMAATPAWRLRTEPLGPASRLARHAPKFASAVTDSGPSTSVVAEGSRSGIRWRMLVVLTTWEGAHHRADGAGVLALLGSVARAKRQAQADTWGRLRNPARPAQPRYRFFG